MSYTEKQLGYARAIVAEGRRLGISVRGLTIGLATALVECDLVMYANRADPETLKYPHERIGSDSKSSGLFQQQPPWWGTAAERMDPTASARMFFQALAKLDYNNASRSPGSYAQAVQRSSFPTRYDERMGHATALYALVSADDPQPAAPAQEGHAVEEFDRSNEGNSSSRFGAKVRLFVLHTEEGNQGAWQLHEWMKRNNVSYHYVLAGGICVAAVNTDRASWSVLDANPYCINLVFAGSKAAQSRQVWLDRYGAEIDYAAKLFVQDAAKYDPLVPLVIGHDEIRAGKAGGTDHFGITKGIGIGSHTDCGPNFPWDVYAAAVQKYATGAGVPVVVAPPVANEIDLMAIAAPWLGERLTVGEIDPGDGRGRLAHFANGSIYWTPTTGARPIPASLFEKFAELNYEHTLGYPVNYHSVLPEGDVQAFENGALYRKRGEPGHWVHGAIGARWFRSGFETSPLGWPTSDEQPQPDGSILQTFEHGQIFWSPDGVTVLQSAGEPDVSVPDSTH
ncbi:hypothetical protein [Rhodococcus sp. MEB041]|uniref:hypothetical protein n=1 Tax=Rhodococcus sp. MEB041 TaxID=3040323 RepID=UPI00254F5ACA|nr:hypothetical protein [Rhodococcus sp. MEB041]